LSSLKKSNQQQTCFVFDFGGVLFDWSPYYLFNQYFNNDKQVVDRFLTDIEFAAFNLEQDKGRPFDEAVAEMVEKFPQYEAALRAYDRDWVVMFGGAIQPTVDILAAIKQAGYPLYALSNWSVDKFDLIKPGQDFLEWFEDIVLSGEEKIAKPDPRIYSILLERAGRRAEECLFIDDSKGNIIAADQLGFNTILYESSEQLKRELQQRGFLN
jgi:2-haloacid dehalogenase